MSNDLLAEPYQVALATDLAGAAVAMWLCVSDPSQYSVQTRVVTTMWGSKAPDSQSHLYRFRKLEKCITEFLDGHGTGPDDVTIHAEFLCELSWLDYCSVYA